MVHNLESGHSRFKITGIRDKAERKDIERIYSVDYRKKAVCFNMFGRYAVKNMAVECINFAL